MSFGSVQVECGGRDSNPRSNSESEPAVKFVPVPIPPIIDVIRMRGTRFELAKSLRH